MTSMEWIKCSDRLPEKGESVLCYSLVGFDYGKKYPREKTIITLYWQDDYGIIEWRADCGCSGYECDPERFDPIYWHPLPEPPKD